MTAEPSDALPTSPERLLARLDELGIVHSTVEHRPVYTVEEAQALRGNLPGGHIKNLFLRNKKGAMWLVVCLEDRGLDLKLLGAALGAGRFSFGSAARLRTHLGVEPGAVTPFALINDRQAAVKAVIDKKLLEFDIINAHPLVNTKTTAVAPTDLLTFLEAEGHAAQVVDLDAI